MAEIILDIGSGRSLHNIPRSEAMIKSVADMDSHKHKITFKAQLFQSAPPNIPLEHDAFDHLYHYAKSFGYDMTSSVFDKDSLAFLLRYRIPFVKIACRPDLYWLIGEVQRKVQVYVSFYNEEPPYKDDKSIKWLFCVRKYPALITDYLFPGGLNYSDHTVGWELFNKANPKIIEKHLCPKREADNPDSGPFSVTPEELREVIA